MSSLNENVKIHSGSVSLSRIKDNSFPFFILHGGAGPQDPKGEKAHAAEQALEEICKKVSLSFSKTNSTRMQGNRFPPWFSQGNEKKLESLSEASHICLYAANLLEENHNFNAGFGAALQEDGVARVSASFMESKNTLFSAIANAESVLHPTLLAAHLQGEKFRVIDGNGAKQLTRQLKVPMAQLITPDRFERWAELKRQTIFQGLEQSDGKGTIGCVSIDPALNLAATTSTGGVGNETLGRMGDTPTVAGNYCTSKVAISCTGYGEQILNHGFAVRVATRTEDGMTLQQSFHKTLHECAEKNYGLAAIALSISHDELHWCAGTTEGFFVWARNESDKIHTFLQP